MYALSPDRPANSSRAVIESNENSYALQWSQSPGGRARGWRGVTVQTSAAITPLRAPVVCKSHVCQTAGQRQRKTSVAQQVVAIKRATAGVLGP